MKAAAATSSPRPPVALDEPDFLVRQVAVPDHQHGHEIDVGDAENGREQQAANIADGGITVAASARASAVKASAPTSEEMATLAPNDDDVNGASSDKYQSIETLRDD